MQEQIVRRRTIDQANKRANRRCENNCDRTHNRDFETNSRTSPECYLTVAAMDAVAGLAGMVGIRRGSTLAVFGDRRLSSRDVTTPLTI
jgi:hypothetical protein